ncbi:class II aldolase/adducin family protein [Rhodobacteraceae bacterium NNCM2]|nr:class II aldolase/adducin family protein [Coraliihabitans acroporae]
MEAAGVNQGKSGNVSARAGDGFLVTPSGLDYGTMTADQIVAMSFDGSWTGEGVRPSSEWRFHRDILAARPEFGAVVHAHPLHATALAVHGRGIPAFHYMVAVAGGTDIRCSGYATFGTQELSDMVLEALEGRSACLMAHHGMIACGRDLSSALDLAVEVETLAAQYLMSMQIGDPPLLGEEEMARVIEKFRSGYGSAQTG